jgi:beta-galactosidase
MTHQREAILFDQIGRGLALTHRPFDALEIGRAELDVFGTPHCWMMIERQCSAEVQQKLVDYVRAGGRLILLGRLPAEDFDHRPVTLLQQALGIRAVNTRPPFERQEIRIFDQPYVPVDFLETYDGDFDEVFARTAEEETVGLIKTLGRGRVMMLGAAVPIGALEDLSVLDQMALKMGIPRLFEVSDWVDVRLSEGENGRFLFVNNYQDDPVETTIRLEGQDLFGGQAVRVEARRGLILPLDWRLGDGLIVHYLTAEVTEIRRGVDEIVLQTEPPRFVAELSLPPGWQVEGGQVLEQREGLRRVRLSGEGEVRLRRVRQPE